MPEASTVPDLIRSVLHFNPLDGSGAFRRPRACWRAPSLNLSQRERGLEGLTPDPLGA